MFTHVIKCFNVTLYSLIYACLSHSAISPTPKIHNFLFFCLFSLINECPLTETSDPMYDCF